MKLTVFWTAFLSFLTTFIVTASAAPVADSANDGSVNIPAESIIGFLDLSDSKDATLVPVSNGTHSGFLFLNSTILSQASTESLKKRSAQPWRWLSLRAGEALHKREADAEADPWQWLSLRAGEALHKREAEAAPWSWLSLRAGEALHKRNANAEAEAAPWRWLSLRAGEALHKREADAAPWRWLSLRAGEALH
ncbi:LAMI_0D10088g1_1 [Lachancea mirantina]|uniref:Mating factor alpha n=1 Tax=Lachancea mirantina TaxID=1230905 RepID=A0A1G4JDW5_9SACH|nr:LAMI_0D10088g1_1 [Lachancea mirantina]